MTSEGRAANRRGRHISSFSRAFPGNILFFYDVQRFSAASAASVAYVCVKTFFDIETKLKKNKFMEADCAKIRCFPGLFTLDNKGRFTRDGINKFF